MERQTTLMPNYGNLKKTIHNCSHGNMLDVFYPKGSFAFFYWITELYPLTVIFWRLIQGDRLMLIPKIQKMMFTKIVLILKISRTISNVVHSILNLKFAFTRLFHEHDWFYHKIPLNLTSCDALTNNKNQRLFECDGRMT